MKIESRAPRISEDQWAKNNTTAGLKHWGELVEWSQKEKHRNCGGGGKQPFCSSYWKYILCLRCFDCTCSVPAVVKPVCCGSGGEPEGQQADDEAEKVHQQVGGIRHHCKTACKIATCRKMIIVFFFNMALWSFICCHQKSIISKENNQIRCLWDFF